MKDIYKIENELYKATYGIPVEGNKKEIWENIKSKKDILMEAVKVKRNKWNNGDIVNGLTICDLMLSDYENVDVEAYSVLVNNIYNNQDIARIVMNGYANGGFSFLLMTLFNHELKLSEEQKSFAVNEAMNKIGTIKNKKEKEDYIKKLENQKITDDIETTVDIDGYITKIGARTKNMYFNHVFNMLSTTQAHGIGAFDIRYHILRNPNWTKEEKQKLIMDFWYDDKTYEEYLQEWEWSVVNDVVDYIDDDEPLLDITNIYEYSYDMLYNIYEDKKIVDNVWNEIQFCKQMHKIRPAKYEL